MLYLIIFLAQLFLLHILSLRLSDRIFQYLFFLTRSKSKSVYFYSFIFLPGTFIHEVSHFMAALLLLVPVGEMKLLPEITEQRTLKMGEVAIARTDILRRFLIGVAPFVFGTVILLLMMYFWTELAGKYPFWVDILVFYLVFEISNTMFSSKKDLEGALQLSVFVLVISLLLYIVGVNPLTFSKYIDSSYIEKILSALMISNIFLLVPILIDLTLLALTGFARRLIRS